MTGTDNGTLQSGVYAQAKQFGSILRGFGPPVPQTGVLGDLYLDVQTWFLYEKRANDDTDPWGHYLFQVPATYRSQLKWFSAYFPGDDIGVIGDYCLAWAGYPNYGLQPSFFGPRLANGWPESGTGIDTAFDPSFTGFTLPVGLVDEGTPVAYSASTQLVACGLADEYILAVPISTAGGVPVGSQGLQSGPLSVAVTLNTLYTAQDEHAP